MCYRARSPSPGRSSGWGMASRAIPAPDACKASGGKRKISSGLRPPNHAGSARTVYRIRGSVSGVPALAGGFSGLDQRLVARLELARLLLCFQALGDVADHGQARRPAVECEIEGDDFHVDLLPALLAVPRHTLHVGTARILKVLEQLRDVLRRAKLLGGHGQKLLPRVAV